ncbi:copper amine oxidase N-terminal domain-containing protein [Bacillus sp. CMF12]|uniref:stalk domain-containing protein n=1 Tax=Bacillus sp. CMF12 TaxID=2884834 RepID=UPI00207AE6B7|nr:stalk domain-containing protein [Bacillus sp. CMF12]USK51526.1 copper amine oxidase N-terminal domain-containing protein [Bacillus sp. CMF12]
MSGIISGMLFWQWQAYSEHAIALESSGAITQEITVETRLKELKITQKIHGLMEQEEYRLVIPDTLFKWKCKNGTGEACDSADENPFTFFSSDDQMTFEYAVPINERNKALLLTDWFVKIPGKKAEGLSITISDSFKREGSWAAGIRLKARKKLDHIDYYYFEGKGNVPILYWQQKPLLKKAINNAEVYSEDIQAASFNFKKLNEIGDFPFLTIIFTDQYPEYKDENILITSPRTKVAQVEKNLITMLFQRKFSEDSQTWVIDVFTAGLLDMKPSSSKGSAVLQELQGELTEDELKAFLRKVINVNSLNAEKLDKLLSDVKGLNTHFFTMNTKSDAPFVPLYFQKEKKLLVSGAEKASIDLIYRDGKRLLPFKATMKALGYEIKILSGEETMLLSKGNNSYRFYLNKNVFIYNEEDYGLLENPLTNQNGTVFMEIQWFKSLFGVTAEEREGEIYLTSDPV